MNNDFHDNESIYAVLDGLEFPKMSQPVESSVKMNGESNGDHRTSNGVSHGVNGEVARSA